MSTIDKIIEYFNENEEIFDQCIEELDSYNGYLDERRCYEMEELNELYSGTEPIEILYRAFYGHDDETCTTDNAGNKTYGEFNPNRTYFYFNGYGNLISCDYKDYSDFLDKHFVNELNENRQYIYTIDNEPKLTELFDELEEENETEGK